MYMYLLYTIYIYVYVYAPNPHHKILVFPDPALGNPWKVLAHPSKYLSNICFWATQPLAKVL